MRVPDQSSLLYRVGERLAAAGSEAAFSHFTQCLEGPDPDLRPYGAWGLGGLALEACVETVEHIFGAEEREIRVAAALGIGRAVASKRGDTAFFVGVQSSLDNFLYFEGADVHSALVVEENERGLAAMSSEERNYFAASRYYFEIMNGGPWQYLANSTSDHHRLIQNALEAIGSPDVARTVEALGAVFGPTGPPEDCEERNALMDAFTDEQSRRLGEAYSHAGELEIPMRLFLYVTQHLAQFRKRAAETSGEE